MIDIWVYTFGAVVWVGAVGIFLYVHRDEYLP